MQNSKKLALGITLVMMASPALANSPYWTTTDGSVVVDSAGNPVRTIHYQSQPKTVVKPQGNQQASLVSMAKNAIARVFNPTPKVEPLLEPEAAVTPDNVSTQELALESVLIKPVPAPTPTPTPTPAPVAVELVKTPKPVNQTTVKPQPQPEPEVAVAPELQVPVQLKKVDYQFKSYATTLLFDTDKAHVTADAMGSLRQLAMAAKKSDDVLTVQLRGHADSRGSQDYNLTLSKARMKKVENFLATLALRVTSKFAMGETDPVLVNGVEDYTLSRRVEVKINTRKVKPE